MRLRFELTAPGNKRFGDWWCWDVDDGVTDNLMFWGCDVRAWFLQVIK